MNLLFAHPALSFSLARSVARSLFVLPLMCCWLPVVQAQTNVAPAAQEAHPLELGKPIERELAGGQSHTYQITLTAGQYLNVIVEQRGIDVVVVLTGPDGKQIFEVNNELRKQGTEIVWQVAEASGSFKFEVRATQKEAPAGRYEIRLVELRAATEQDRTLQEARTLYAEGDRLFRANKHDEARPLIERSLEMREQVLGTEHLDVAQSLNRLGTIYSNKRDYAKAEPLLQRALAIREKVLGPEHPNLAGLLSNLENLYYEKGDYAQAEPLSRRALAIREKTLGPDDLSIAQALNRLATIYFLKGDPDKAEPLIQRAVAIREKALGPDHVDVAVLLDKLAIFNFMKGEYSKAQPLFQRVVAIYEKAHESERIEVADSLVLLGKTYWLNKADYEKAELAFQRALTIKEKVLGMDHPKIIDDLFFLSSFYTTAKIDFGKAESLLQRALAICEKKLAPDHEYLVKALTALANLSVVKSDYAQAELLYRKALTIEEKKKGAEDVSVSVLAYLLAGVQLGKMELTEAESLYRRALTIQEKKLGAENPALFAVLNDFGSLYMVRGDYKQAESFLQRAQTISEKAYGAENISLAYSLERLALLSFYVKHDFNQAEQLYQRALAIFEKNLGRENPQLTATLSGLAWVYLAKNEYALAEPLLQRALIISEKAYGSENYSLYLTLTIFGGLRLAQGNYAEAERLYQRVLAITEKTFGSGHFNSTVALQGLAEAQRLKGDLAQAVALRTRGNEISERFINLTVTGGSERQKLELLAYFIPETSSTILLHALSAPNDSAALSLALTTLLRRKGRALDMMTDAIAQLRRRAAPEDQSLIDQFTTARSQLATASFKEPQPGKADAYRAQLKQLTEQVEKLEVEISARSAEFRAQSQPVTLAAVQAVIPDDKVLVEFAYYEPQDFSSFMLGKSGSARYAAYVMTKQGQPRWVDLGEAKAIDDAVGKLREALRDKTRRDVKKLAREVDRLVMQPVRPLLKPTRRVFISPDGALNLIPFAALVDERGQYLVRTFEFSYLTSGRDLLRLQIKQPNKQNAMVVANPDFGGTGATTSEATRRLKYIPSDVKTSKDGAVLAEYYFPVLSGTASEARALKSLLPSATVLTGANATEATLKQISSPRVLHIATHGFFLEDQAAVTGNERLLQPMSGNANAPIAVRIANPLLRSGLALAGANQPKAEGDDGILTALEASGLDLWGTKLVVLSACDTGVGEVKNGEGVYGLRRALMLAGSETQVMSLWPVSDLGTRDLMIGYYKRLLAGQGRTEALRNTQLEMLRSGLQSGNDASRLLVRKGQTNPTNSGKKDRSHPYYWASFIQSGEWANLDGKR